MYINKKQMRWLLEEFQKYDKEVKCKDRIKYADWRELKSADEAYISFDDCKQGYYISLGDTYHFFPVSEDGFGRFLWNYIDLESEEFKNMGNVYTNNATCYDSNGNKLFNCEVSGLTATSCSDSTNNIVHKPYTNSTNTTGNDILNTTLTYDTKTNSWGLSDQLATVADSCSTINSSYDELISKIEKYYKNDKLVNDVMEDKKMKGFNFDFGPCDNSKVHLSMYGIAVKNKVGEWVSYNPASGDIINVDIFNIDNMAKFIYKMPVASNAIEVGDVIVHNGCPMFVLSVGEEFKSFDVVDVIAGESKTIIPTKNMFGFDVMVRVVSLFDATASAPTADQPFGNMLPFLMMGDGNIDPMAMMLMMNQNGGSVNPFGNPMMMYMLMKDSKDIDPMLFMLMSQNQPHTCHCKNGK